MLPEGTIVVELVRMPARRNNPEITHTNAVVVSSNPSHVSFFPSMNMNSQNKTLTEVK